jgi:hypothetical protein
MHHSTKTEERISFLVSGGDNPEKLFSSDADVTNDETVSHMKFPASSLE